MSKKIYIKHNFINRSIDFDELNCTLLDEFGFDWGNDSYYEFIYEKYQVNCEPPYHVINIDDFEKCLANMKLEGANYFSIEDDSHGYILNAWDVNLLGDDDIKEYEQALEEKKKEKHIEYVRLRLEELEEYKKTYGLN